MNSYSTERDKLVSRRKFKLQKNLIQNFNKLIKAFLRYEKKECEKGNDYFKETAQILFMQKYGKKKTIKKIRLDNKTQTTYDSSKS